MGRRTNSAYVPIDSQFSDDTDFQDTPRKVLRPPYSWKDIALLFLLATNVVPAVTMIQLSKVPALAFPIRVDRLPQYYKE